MWFKFFKVFSVEFILGEGSENRSRENNWEAVRTVPVRDDNGLAW